jgi:hypothetical protein
VQARSTRGLPTELFGVLQAGHIQFYASSSQRAQSVEGIAMPVVKFPGQPKRPPFAVAAFDPKRERMLPRAERVVELLGSRAIRDGWSFDKNRAAVSALPPHVRPERR